MARTLVPLTTSATQALFEKSLELISQRREIVSHCLPNDAQVDAEVLMDQNVPHACDISPWHAGREAFLVRGQVPNSLTDDFEVADNCVDSLLIGLELLETQTSYVSFDLRDSLENVLDAKAPFSRRQQPPREGFCREAEA